MSDDFDALIRGPEEPRPEPTRSDAAPRPPKQPSGALPWIVVSLVAVVLVGGGVALAFLGPWGADDAAPPPPVASDPAESPSDEPLPEPVVPEPGGAALPAECRDLFSDSYYAELASTGATLSEQDTGPEAIFDPDVPEVLELTIADAPHIECRWGFADNFSVGILTVVAQVGSEQSMQVTDALESAGFTGVPEFGSIRYIRETPANESFGPSGYSIFVRDGILIATRWLDWPAVGYTADIVNTVLPPLE